MLNKNELQDLRVKIAIYENTLDLDTVKKEFLGCGLLSKNSKLSKAIATFGLEMVPANLSSLGTNCINFLTCVGSCLFLSGIDEVLKGRSGELSNTLKKRVRRNFLFYKDRKFFMILLRANIEALKVNHSLLGETLAIRLNTLTDIDFSEFIASIPKVQFYDYTKVYNRKQSENYHLTYSFNGDSNQWALMDKLLRKGNNVAVVFHGDLPDYYKGFSVINGDLSDDRTLDDRGVVVGLRIKTTRKGGDKNSLLVASN